MTEMPKPPRRSRLPEAPAEASPAMADAVDSGDKEYIAFRIPAVAAREFRMSAAAHGEKQIWRHFMTIWDHYKKTKA